MTDEEGSERGTYFTADEDDDGQGKRAGEVPAVIRDDAVPQGSGNGVSEREADGQERMVAERKAPDPPEQGGLRGMMRKLTL